MFAEAKTVDATTSSRHSKSHTGGRRSLPVFSPSAHTAKMAHALVILLAIVSAFVLSEGLQTCVPGSKLQENCNECTCIAGRWSCTEKKCPPANNKQCIEGKTWRDGCKECVCNNGAPICTRKNCSRSVRSVSCLFHTGEYFRDPTPGSCYLCRCQSSFEAMCDDYDVKCGFGQMMNKVKNKLRAWFS